MRWLAVLCLLLAGLATASADTIALWNFNSPAPDGTTGTGSLQPATGVGYCTVQGDVATAFATGDARDAGADNSAVSVSHFPAATNLNRSAGLRFDVSTEGYEQITVTWCQRNSSSASKYVRLQYTLDGFNFQNSEVLAMAVDSMFTNRTVGFAGIAGVANNPAFGIRFVTEWERTATGSGAEAYAATAAGSTYGTAGTIRFDLVTVAGVLQPGGNHPPTISTLPAQTVRLGRTTDPVEFTVLDAEDPATELFLSAESSDPAVVSWDNVIFGGTSSSRTLALKAGYQTGTALITVRVTDRGGKFTTTTFAVTVLPENLPPTISTIPPQYLLAGAPAAPIPFTVTDAESSSSALTVTAISSAPALVPTQSLVLGGTGSTRLLSISPAPGRFGLAPITLSVSDGVNVTQTVFPAVILPNTAALLVDKFDYGDGSIVTNSANLWYTRSGSSGELRIVDGQLQVTATGTEDVAALLLNGPYTPGTQSVLFASCRLQLPSLPQKAGRYFAHFGSGSTMSGRIYAAATNAAPGYFRLLISNGAGWPVAHPALLEPNRSYRVVMAYAVDTGASTLWVDPVSELDQRALAVDPITPGKISIFGFRQSTDIGGEYLIDDLRIGLSFAAVTMDSLPGRPKLGYGHAGGNLVLSWATGAGTLQAGARPQGPFTNIPGATVSPFQIPLTGAPRFFRLVTP